MTAIGDQLERTWTDDIVPALQRYLTIPNVSVAYDADWAEHGYMDEAVQLIREWCAARQIEGLTVDVHRLPGRTPLILAEVPASKPELASRTVLLYGHLDKQPEMTGWRNGLGPWTPVIEGDRLYGRGGADDGYAAFAALAAIEAAQAHGLDHARCIVVIEAAEESGSPDLPAYLERFADVIGRPDLVVCLDSGAADTERLWVTTSLRGLAGGTLTAEVLTEGMHSGYAGGIVPSSFRVLRQLLDRVEDAATGEVLVPEAHVEIPADRLAEAAATAAELDRPAAAEFPFAGATRPMVEDPVEQLLARTWRPSLSYVGADGFPPTSRAGNVLRPSTSLALSLRLPPTCDADAASRALEQALTTDPPSAAAVTFDHKEAAPGWNAPPFAPWLADALAEVSTTAFGQPARTIGEGGTIPFMGMLGALFPAAQFVVTGVLVPGSNAHGPNEFLHLPTARRVTECVALLLAAHARASISVSA
jgi:acetylornithine deacetylase/succinyl-diaminopimelate desuccinylase-like protein